MPQRIVSSIRCIIKRMPEHRNQHRRAGLYDRVSRKVTGREVRSTEEQHEANSAACERYGWSAAARYTDPGV